MNACEALVVPGRRQLELDSIVGIGVGSACDDHKSVLGSRTKKSVSILEYQALFGLKKVRGGRGRSSFRSYNCQKMSN